MTFIAHRVFATVALAGASVLAGCAHEQAAPPAPLAPPEPPPVAVTRTTSEAVPAKPAPEPGINVSDAILKACSIHFDNVETAPKFDFDESEVRTGERALLGEVATCVTAGPLKGRALHLVGRADPRGEAEYNLSLGESRAGSVRAYLMNLGVDSSQITTTSRGKLDATGADEATWQIDRRVDVDLR